MTRRAALLTVAAALALTAFAGYFFLFRQTIQASTHFTLMISPQLGPWTALREGKVSAGEIRGLETSDVIRRHYRRGPSVIEAVIAHIPISNRKSAHAQEACLRGSGAMVSRLEKVSFPELPLKATHIEMDYAGRKVTVLYWYKFGHDHTSDYIRSIALMSLSALKGDGPRGSTLIRLLTPRGENETPDQALARLREFSRPLIGELNDKLP